MIPKLKKLFRKTLKKAIMVGEMTVPYIWMKDQDLFESIDDIFDIQDEGFTWLEEEFGPTFFLGDGYGLHYFNNGVWHFNCTSPRGLEYRTLANYSEKVRQNGKSNDQFGDKKVLKLKQIDFEKETNLIFTRLRGYRLEVLLIPEEYKYQWDVATDPHIHKLKRNILPQMGPNGIVAYY